MNDREFKEWADNVARKKASVLSLLDGLTDYVMSGAAERNARGGLHQTARPG